MNELHKLRTENEDLLRKIDASSLDALDLLECQIADQKCVNSSLQVSAYKLIVQLYTLDLVDCGVRTLAESAHIFIAGFYKMGSS